MLWTGRILGALVVLFLLFDGGMHVIAPTPVIDAMTRLAIQPSLALWIGIIELVCLALYVTPATSVLGAVLLTGYLGGAVSIHMRAGSPVFEAYVFPVLVGAMVWGALLLRDDRLRALVFRRSAKSRSNFV